MSSQTNNDIVPQVLWGKANELVKDLNRDQILWLGGYLSGVGLASSANGNGSANGHVVEAVANASQAAPADFKLTVLYGTHSGNSKIVAEALSAEANERGVETELVSMPDFKIKKLKSTTHLLVVVSTHGKGEPPVAAEEIHRLLEGKRAGKLDHLKYAVVGLGDSSYLDFCQTGIDFHERLKALGGEALGEPTLLDVDFKDNLAEVKKATLDLFHPAGGSAVAQVEASTEVSANVSPNGIYEAEVLDIIQLNGRGSDKETYHVEISLEDSGLTYKPGDALEIFAHNEEPLVDSIIEKFGYSKDEIVVVDGVEKTVREALIFNREITVITLPVLKKLAAFVQEGDINKILDNRDELEGFLEGSDLLDLTNTFKLSVTAQDLINSLRKLPPRAYSIASAQSEVDEEVHLTIGAVRYSKHDRDHNGACSVMLADRVEVGEKIFVRVSNNDGFRLPEDTSKPIIMVGPGTGIAPFRSFLQEREASDAEGKNWLFFGDQHFETDFLYQAELLKYRSKGQLKIDVAFSRDQEEKIYVQHRIKEKAQELYQWINEGAYIYICGDRKRMAVDVKQAFVEVISEQAGISLEDAETKFSALRQEGRFQEDVY